MTLCDGCCQAGATVKTRWASVLGHMVTTTHPGCEDKAVRTLAERWYGGEMPKRLPDEKEPEEDPTRPRLKDLLADEEDW